MARLDKLPEHGLVLLGHPVREPLIIKRAEQEGLDYVVRDIVEPGTIFVLNCDAFRADFPEDPPSRGVCGFDG